jgi:hypothetical protein
MTLAITLVKRVLNNLKDLSLYKVSGEPCLFINEDGVIIFFYINDIILLYHPEAILKLYKLRITLIQRYEIRDLGELSWFLGIRIIRDRL